MRALSMAAVMLAMIVPNDAGTSSSRKADSRPPALASVARYALHTGGHHCPLTSQKARLVHDITLWQCLSPVYAYKHVRQGACRAAVIWHESLNVVA